VEEWPTGRRRRTRHFAHPARLTQLKCQHL